MARIVVNTQNLLFADMLKKSLRSEGDFTVYVVKTPGDVIAEFNNRAANIVLMEVTAYTPWKLEERMKLCSAIKQTDPSCKVVLMVDENAEEQIAESVKRMKMLGQIDQFVFNSISASYFVALMDTL